MGLISTKLFKRSKIPTGFKGSDPARAKEQAFELAKSYPEDMPALVVKTGEKGDIYPYTIYIREMFGNKDATKQLKKKYG